MSPEQCERLEACRLTVFADDFRRMVERHKRPNNWHKPKVPAWLMRVIAEGVMVPECNVPVLLRFPGGMLPLARRIGVGPPCYVWARPAVGKRPFHYYLLDEVIDWLCKWEVAFYPGQNCMPWYHRQYYGQALGTVKPKGGPHKAFKRGDLPATMPAST